jgi:Arc/MetJ-type ribon-helix-helix transcriptional regulator|tara:strand:+ start:122 stop:277 length:156 start_codon:yes stop_codon:yes gene_type:complete
MKKKLSISIDEETIIRLDDYVSGGYFRNKSHVVEVAINKMIKEDENEIVNS